MRRFLVWNLPIFGIAVGVCLAAQLMTPGFWRGIVMGSLVVVANVWGYWEGRSR